MEKTDLARKVAELAAAGPVAAGASAPVYPAPPGFAFEPSTGFFLDAQSGMRFDQTSGFFFKGAQWFTWDAGAGRYAEVRV